MRVVRDDEGHRYLLIEERTDEWLVRDPATGAEHTRQAAALTEVGTAPLTAAAAAIPAPVRQLILATATEPALGLVLELADRGPTPARTLIAAVDLCESDLLGVVGELRAAGIVTTTDVAGEPGYRLTDVGRRGVAALRTTTDLDPESGAES